MVACQCAPLVTSADRPAKHGWAHDQSVNNAGVAKGRILSRNAAGASTPDPEAEACMRKILKETYPTLEIVLTVLCTLGPLFLLLVTFVCIL